jgi:VIT1/CCC1 family predicted Fe2+/Mn2+ transporter
MGTRIWAATDPAPTISATLASVGLTAVASLIVGAVVARSSERTVLFGAARQLGIVLAAAAVTYGIGRLFGASVG